MDHKRKEKKWKRIKKKDKKDKTKPRVKFRSLDQEIHDDDARQISKKIERDCGDMFRTSREGEFDEDTNAGKKARDGAFNMMVRGAQGLATEHAPLFGNLLLSPDFTPCNDENAPEVRGVQAKYLQAYDSDRQYAHFFSRFSFFAQIGIAAPLVEPAPQRRLPHTQLRSHFNPSLV